MLHANRKARAIGTGVGLVGVAIGYAGFKGYAALSSLSPSTKGYVLTALLSALDPDPSGQNKFPGKGRIATTIQAANSITKAKDKANIVTKGVGAAAVPAGASSEPEVNGEAGAQSLNREADTIRVRLPSETGSRISRTIEVCVDKERCG